MIDMHVLFSLTQFFVFIIMTTFVWFKFAHTFVKNNNSYQYNDVPKVYENTLGISEE